MNAQIVTVNLIPDLSTPAVVRVSQYDVGRPLTFKVLDGTGTASFDATTTATVTGTKPSGLGFTESGTIAGNTVTLSTTLAMTQECGKIPTEIRFTQTGEDIGTANFILAVEPSPHPEGTTDGTQETMANLETRLQGQIDALDSRIDAIEGDQSIIDDIDALDARVTALEQGGSGLSQTEKNLILTLFSKAAYAEDDASTAYDALEAMWASTTKTITYNLTDVMSSNTQTSIESGQIYTTALAVRQGYTLNTVTVTMGGVDITSTSYSSGTVSIPSVTGNIVITATAEEISTALYPLETGTTSFSDTNKIVSVSNGNIVHGINTSGSSGGDIHANISQVTLNTSSANATANYSVATQKLFTIPSGASVTATVTPLSLTYSTGMGTATMNVALRDQSGTNLHVMIDSTAYQSLTVGTPVITTFTAESDMDVWNIGMWLKGMTSRTVDIELELKLMVNDTRYI